METRGVRKFLSGTYPLMNKLSYQLHSLLITTTQENKTLSTALSLIFCTFGKVLLNSPLKGSLFGSLWEKSERNAWVRNNKTKKQF